MWFGYNSNGFAHHRLTDTLAILAELGYEGIALTLDIATLDPFDAALARHLAQFRGMLDSHKLRVVIETGARFLLNPRHKHQPTLLSPSVEERGRRLQFLRRAVRIAAELNAEAVSFWSGTPLDAVPEAELYRRLTAGCLALCEEADRAQVRLAFEPEPGMFIDTMTRYAELAERIDHPRFGLTLDIGHLQCMREMPSRPHMERWRDRLWNIHIEDMKPGVHDHLLFGEGTIDFVEVFRALQAIDYQGGVCVELSRHSHDAVRTAEHSLRFLRRVFQEVHQERVSNDFDSP